MAQRVYATAADYDEFADEPFDGTEQQLTKRLRRASADVDSLTRLSQYRVDEDGMPLDQEIADAFMEATCAQVEYWETTGDPTGAESQMGPVRIGSVSLGGSGVGGSAKSTGTAAGSRISPEAIEILQNAGLAPHIAGTR